MKVAIDKNVTAANTTSEEMRIDYGRGLDSIVSTQVSYFRSSSIRPNFQIDQATKRETYPKREGGSILSKLESNKSIQKKAPESR